jgi:hypothetical protein
MTLTDWLPVAAAVATALGLLRFVFHCVAVIEKDSGEIH